MSKLLFVILAIGSITLSALAAPQLVDEYQCAAVVRVIDGDTFSLNGENVRILGVQAPERGEAGYQRAGRDLAKLLRAPVKLERYGKDRYGRTLAVVYSGSTSVNAEMRRRYTSSKYDKLLSKAQREALIKSGWRDQ